jgi:hypothetical protein
MMRSRLQSSRLHKQLRRPRRGTIRLRGDRQFWPDKQPSMAVASDLSGPTRCTLTPIRVSKWRELEMWAILNRN